MLYGIVSGYGVSTEEVQKVDNVKKVDFIKRHVSDFYTAMAEDTDNIDDADYLINEYVEQYAGEIGNGAGDDLGFWGMFSDVISDETGYDFVPSVVRDDEENKVFNIIIYPKNKLQSINSSEKQLACTEDVERILDQYLSELGISRDKYHFSYLDMLSRV